MQDLNEAMLVSFSMFKSSFFSLLVFFLVPCSLFRGLDRCDLGYLVFSSLWWKSPSVSLHTGMCC